MHPADFKRQIINNVLHIHYPSQVVYYYDKYFGLFMLLRYLDLFSHSVTVFTQKSLLFQSPAMTGSMTPWQSETELGQDKIYSFWPIQNVAFIK